MTTLTIRLPEHWWTATREDFPDLGDVDATEGARAHRGDRDQRHWSAIAAVVQAVGRALTTGNYTPDPDDASWVEVTVNTSSLDREDEKIVETWFGPGEHAPRSDGWWPELTNGRRRVWSTWQAAPDALLPLYSELLGSTDGTALATVPRAGGITANAAAGLGAMLPNLVNPKPGEYVERPGVAARNPRYVEELATLARAGGHQVDS